MKKWRFPSNDYGEIRGGNELGTNEFQGREIEVLVNEICQEALKNKISSPVLIEFNLFDIDNNQIPSRKDLIETYHNCRDFWGIYQDNKIIEFCDKAITEINKEKSYGLRISDFNTTGLTGSIGSLNSLWMNSVKTTGLYNNNKLALFSSSLFSTVFYNTYDITGIKVFQGVTRLVTFKDENNDYKQGIGYYGKEKNEAIEGQISLDDSFYRLSGEYGTDIYILGYKNFKHWRIDFLNTVLSNYLVEIWNEDLTLRIDGRNINKKTLDGIINCYSNQLEEQNKVSDFEILKACVEIFLYELNDLKNTEKTIELRNETKDNSEVEDTTVVNIENITDDEKQSLKIEDFFSENKYNIFVSYCIENKYIFMEDLEGFEFGKLSTVRGFGVGKLKSIIEKYNSYDKNSNYSESESCFPSTKMDKNTLVYEYVHEDLQNLNIEKLIVCGWTNNMISKLKHSEVNTLNDLTKLTDIRSQRILTSQQYVKIKETEMLFHQDYPSLINQIINKDIISTEESDAKIVIEKQNKYTLQEIGEKYGVTRERIRQIIKKYCVQLLPIILEWCNQYFKKQGHLKQENIEQTFDNEDVQKIVSYILQNTDKIEWLSFAQVYVLKEEVSKLEKCKEIISEFIGEGIDLYEYLEEFEEVLQENNLEYISLDSWLELMRENGYQQYGDYITKRKTSYAVLCERIIRDEFPKGIGIYDKEDLDKLRIFANERYGQIGIPDDVRSFGLRLSAYLVLCDRGKYISPSNIKIDYSELKEIKSCIEKETINPIYYSALFGKYSSEFRFMDIDNYHYLHGIIQYYFPDDYEYTDRDYMRKKTNQQECISLEEAIIEVTKENNGLITTQQFKNNFTGNSYIRIMTIVESIPNLIPWGYNQFKNTDMLTVTMQDKDRLYSEILSCITKYKGYCSSRLLFNLEQQNGTEFLAKNDIKTADCLHYLCEYYFGDEFDFRKPHIAQKNLFTELISFNIIMYLMDNPNYFSYEDYVMWGEKLCWSEGTHNNMFIKHIDPIYIRISDDRYVREEVFEISKEQIEAVEQYIDSNITSDGLSLILFEAYDELPEINYSWNKWVLHSILDKYSGKYKVIEPRMPDRRYERGIIINQDLGINTYDELVYHILKNNNIESISEAELYEMLILKGFVKKILPQDLYDSNKIIYKKERFILVG